MKLIHLTSYMDDISINLDNIDIVKPHKDPSNNVVNSMVVFQGGLSYVLDVEYEELIEILNNKLKVKGV